MKSNRARRRDAGDAHDSRDRLSQLPIDLLLNILERMDTLDALRACIVSKQMQKLPAMLSQIVIVLGHNELLQKNGIVANITGNILSKRSPQITIRKLKIKLFLIPTDCRSIGKSVGLAMTTQKLDAVEFEIVTPKNSYNCKDADLLNFARQFNTFLADSPDAFSGLTRLQLQNLRFGESDIPNILSTCKRLESLSFFECDAGILSVLHVEHAALIELDISYGQFKTVQLNCRPKLQQMSYNWLRQEFPLVLGFVPQLSRLSLTNACLFSDKTIMLSQLLANVSSVSDLYLDFRSEKGVIYSQLVLMGYIRRVMEAAVNIKDVSLHGRKVCKFCADNCPHVEVRPSTYPRTCEEKDSIRKKITSEPTMMASPAVINFRS